MPRAIWRKTVIADSNATLNLEGNHYFPPQSVNMDLLKPAGETYTCSWKGTCDYYDVQVKGHTNHKAAWVYRNPSPAAAQIKDYFAFWQGVEIED